MVPILKTVHLTNAVSITSALRSLWPLAQQPASFCIFPRDFQKRAMILQMNAAPPNINMEKGVGGWEEAHPFFLSYESRNGTSDKQTPCD